jgi:predicted aspartyl protease
MITGIVEGLEARVPIRIKGSAGQEAPIVAVVDTGFTGSLTLPPALVNALHLRWQKVERGTLADGSECLFDV